MSKRRKSPLNLLFLAAFLFINLSINYFHTDAVINISNEENVPHTHPDSTDNPENHECPACHFLNVSFSTNQIHFFYLSSLANFGVLEGHCVFTYTSSFLVNPASRSPPLPR